MNIEFSAWIASVRANIVDAYVVISAQCKLNQIDEDDRDNLAELCSLALPADVSITTPDGKRLDLTCKIDGFRGNLAEKTCVVSIWVPRGEITPEAEGLLALSSRMEREVLFNITNRQLKLEGFKVEIKSFEERALRDGV